MVLRLRIDLKDYVVRHVFCSHSVHEAAHCWPNGAYAMSLEIVAGADVVATGDLRQ